MCRDWDIPVEIVLGWGLLSQFCPFRYFPIFSESSKHHLHVEYHVHIWQVSPQPSCGDTCQTWMWFEWSNICFCKIENFPNGEINEQTFSNPCPSMEATAACKRLMHCGLVMPYRDRSGWILAQVMVCYLMVPSHYLNQCWLIFSEVMLYSLENNSTVNKLLFCIMSLKILLLTFLQWASGLRAWLKSKRFKLRLQGTGQAVCHWHCVNVPLLDEAALGLFC